MDAVQKTEGYTPFTNIAFNCFCFHLYYAKVSNFDVSSLFLHVVLDSEHVINCRTCLNRHFFYVCCCIFDDCFKKSEIKENF